MFIFFVSRNRVAITLLAIVWIGTILLACAISILNSYTKPLKLFRQDIIGEYRIDTNFYSGKNAQWQYRHYKFYITDHDSIFFIAINGNGMPEKNFKHKIIYSVGPPDRWKIEIDSASTHHVIRNQATLFRSHSRFYYVFKSDYYGNMFFRKVEK